MFIVIISWVGFFKLFVFFGSLMFVGYIIVICVVIFVFMFVWGFVNVGVMFVG